MPRSWRVRATVGTTLVGAVLGCLWLLWSSSQPHDEPASATVVASHEVAEPIPPKTGVAKAKPAKRSPAPTAQASAAVDPFAEVPGETYAVARVADDYAGLAQRADDGDMVAARTLSRSLLACNMAPKSADDLRILAESARDGKHDYSWWPAGAEAYVEHQTQLYQRCGSLSDSQLGSRSRWIELLAAAGDSEARVQYPFTNQPNDPHRIDTGADKREFVRVAQGYLQSEIEAGNASALSAMALAYSRPVLVGQESPFGVDTSRAYIYRYAYALTEEGRLYASSLETSLARLEKDLDPQEVSNLRRQAETIYQQCCH